MSKILVNARFENHGINDLAGNDWTNQGATFNNPGKFGGQSITFANNQRMFSNDDFRLETEDYTIALWVKTAPQNGKYCLPISQYTPSMYYGSWSLSTSPDFVAGFNIASQSRGVKFGSRKSVNDEQWHHLALTRKENTLYLFLDGILDDTLTIQPTDYTGLDTKPLCLGVDEYDYQSFVGELDDIVIIKGKALWTEDFTPPDDYLVDSIDGGGEARELNLHILLDVNETVDLTGYIHPIAPNVPQLVWSSGNITIASVDQNGKVTGNAVGITKVHVKTPDDSWSAFVRIIVEEEGMSDLRLSVLLEPDETCRLKALFLPNGTDKPVVWSSSNTAVATVTSNGKVTAVSVGEAIITVKTVDGSLSDYIYVTVLDEKA